MRYYKVILHRSLAPELIYSFDKQIDIGKVVTVTLQKSIKKATVIQEVDKPDFDTLQIVDISNYFYSTFQIETAKFIAYYYFSSLSEALSLFIPYHDEIKIKYIDFTPQNPLPSLTPAQIEASKRVDIESKSLLFGVTGSGKTEIFITQIAKTLQSGKNAILLMPEISLTPQMLKRLQHYFGEQVALWHSKLTKKQKENTLKRILNGEIRIIAGARSALFVPLDNIGLIVVDEEHDDSYKSMTKPRYNAKDLAIYIADRLNAKVILSSATPSLKSYVKFPTIRLKEAYITTKKIYKFIPNGSLESTIMSYLEQNYLKDEQSLVFVPTRANYKYLWCQACGETHKCPFCSVGMSLHRKNRFLKCHYCNYTEPIRVACAKCGYEPLKSDRIGTQEVAQIIKERIPQAKVEIFDKDTITTPTKLQKALKRIEDGTSNIAVGTQMLSKGHDYPNITLSVITGLDFIVGVADYRAMEKAVSLLHQIAGRSGRNKSAVVLIESAKEDFFKEWIGDYEEFLKYEIEFAKGFYPPFMHLARVIIEHKNWQKAQEMTYTIRDRLSTYKEIEIVGAGKSAIEKISNRYRYNILLRSTKRVALLKALHKIELKSGIIIDMDPIDFT